MKLDKFHLKTGIDKDILGVGQDCVHFGFGDVQHLVKFLQGKSSNANIPLKGHFIIVHILMNIK